MLNGWCVALSLSMIQSKAFVYYILSTISRVRFMVKYNALYREREREWVKWAFSLQRLVYYTIPCQAMYEYMSQPVVHTQDFLFINMNEEREKKMSIDCLSQRHWLGIFRYLITLLRYVFGWPGLEVDDVMMRMCKEFDFMNECERGTKDVNVHFHLWNP